MILPASFPFLRSSAVRSLLLRLAFTCWALAAVAAMLITPAHSAHAAPERLAQGATGSICVDAFTDLNGNGKHDPEEALFSGVGAGLLQNGVLIANLFLDGKVASPCFRGLLPGTYDVQFAAAGLSFSSRARTTLTVTAGGRSDVGLGVTPLADQARAAANNITITLTRPVRLGMALGGALLVMAAMTGLGMVLRNLYAIALSR